MQGCKFYSIDHLHIDLYYKQYSNLHCTRWSNPQKNDGSQAGHEEFVFVHSQTPVQLDYYHSQGY